MEGQIRNNLTAYPNVSVWHIDLFHAIPSELDTMECFTMCRRERYKALSRVPLEYIFPSLLSAFSFSLLYIQIALASPCVLLLTQSCLCLLPSTTSYSCITSRPGWLDGTMLFSSRKRMLITSTFTTATRKERQTTSIHRATPLPLVW